jgi:hypothetical protein
MNPPIRTCNGLRLSPALGSLCDELVFVGGCAAGLLCTSVQAPPPRATFDVDLVAEVTALMAYHALEARFARLGFSPRHDNGCSDLPLAHSGIEVDLMPTDERVLGFSNRWYPLAIATAQQVTLPSGPKSADRGTGIPGHEVRGLSYARRQRSDFQP